MGKNKMGIDLTELWQWEQRKAREWLARKKRVKEMKLAIESEESKTRRKEEKLAKRKKEKLAKRRTEQLERDRNYQDRPNYRENLRLARRYPWKAPELTRNKSVRTISGGLPTLGKRR